MATQRSKLDRNRIAEFCQRHRIRRLALFGSVLRDAAQSRTLSMPGA